MSSWKIALGAESLRSLQQCIDMSSFFFAMRQFARVAKGVDLRSTAGNCAWARTPQLTLCFIASTRRCPPSWQDGPGADILDFAGGVLSAASRFRICGFLRLAVFGVIGCVFCLCWLRACVWSRWPSAGSPCEFFRVCLLGVGGPIWCILEQN